VAGMTSRQPTTPTANSTSSTFTSIRSADSMVLFYAARLRREHLV
jgi:hypothetical protein